MADPNVQDVAPETVYPELQLNLQLDPEARLKLHVPRLPLAGAVREHPASNIRVRANSH